MLIHFSIGFLEFLVPPLENKYYKKISKSYSGIVRNGDSKTERSMPRTEVTKKVRSRANGAPILSSDNVVVVEQDLNLVLRSPFTRQRSPVESERSFMSGVSYGFWCRLTCVVVQMALSRRRAVDQCDEC